MKAHELMDGLAIARGGAGWLAGVSFADAADGCETDAIRTGRTFKARIPGSLLAVEAAIISASLAVRSAHRMEIPGRVLVCVSDVEEARVVASGLQDRVNDYFIPDGVEVGGLAWIEFMHAPIPRDISAEVARGGVLLIAFVNMQIPIGKIAQFQSKLAEDGRFGRPACVVFEDWDGGAA